MKKMGLSEKQVRLMAKEIRRNAKRLGDIADNKKIDGNRYKIEIKTIQKFRSAQLIFLSALERVLK